MVIKFVIFIIFYINSDLSSKEILSNNINCGSFSRFDKISDIFLENAYNKKDSKFKDNLYLCIHFLPQFVKKAFKINLKDTKKEHIYIFDGLIDSFRNYDYSSFAIQQRGGKPFNLAVF